MTEIEFGMCPGLVECVFVWSGNVSARRHQSREMEQNEPGGRLLVGRLTDPCFFRRATPGNFSSRRCQIFHHEVDRANVSGHKKFNLLVVVWCEASLHVGKEDEKSVDSES